MLTGSGTLCQDLVGTGVLNEMHFIHECRAQCPQALPFSRVDSPREAFCEFFKLDQDYAGLSCAVKAYQAKFWNGCADCGVSVGPDREKFCGAVSDLQFGDASHFWG
eukprot:3779276-Amphidinium_carterae.2